ncbi:MAG: PqqD family protein [Anaerolineales bacterium]|nr:PqqD family protein [Anaerolineales bacterium]MCB0013698.1 PqqD family protein [Anaerolineales bacterium]MCB0017229.1 PqqD family protein [Anaerolineales bacterium]MCB0030465.1 PqqD family protein [Anaerolineales bacterium]
MNKTEFYPKPHPQTAGRVIDGEAVLILSDDSEINVLNAVGSRIFALADGSRTVGEIATAISDEFEVEPAEALNDVVEFLDNLVADNVMAYAETKEA